MVRIGSISWMLFSRYRFCLTSFPAFAYLESRVIYPGLPMGPPYGKRDPYYSHIFRDSYGSGMGIVWVSGPIVGGH